MIRGLGERSQSRETGGKAETGGFTPENMSQVKFRGGAAAGEVRVQGPSNMAAENQARMEQMAQKRAELLKMMRSADEASNELNRVVNGKVEQMGGGAVKLDTGQQQPKKGLFSRFGRR
jgi:hypothetical protein